MQKINEKMEQMQNKSDKKYTSNKQKLKKLSSLRKKAIKNILEHDSMFTLKFLLAWTKTLNF